MRINPVENLPTVVVIPIPARKAEFANLFVTLTIAGRNLATPTLNTTENQSLVELLAYMKANLGTDIGVSLINLLHETCNLYDLTLRQLTRKVGELSKTPTKSWQINYFTTEQNPDSWTCERTGNYKRLLPIVEVR